MPDFLFRVLYECLVFLGVDDEVLSIGIKLFLPLAVCVCVCVQIRTPYLETLSDESVNVRKL